MGVSPKMRFEVLKRDGFACCYCGRRAPAVVLHVDHIVPRAEGGSDDSGNLQTACRLCNLGKAAGTLPGIEAEVPDEMIDPAQKAHAVSALSEGLALALDCLTSLLRNCHLYKDDIDWEIVRRFTRAAHMALLDHGEVEQDISYRDLIREYRTSGDVGRFDPFFACVHTPKWKPQKSNC